MLVCEVAVGDPYETTRTMPGLTEPPPNYQSVLGCKESPDVPSDFKVRNRSFYKGTFVQKI